MPTFDFLMGLATGCVVFALVLATLRIIRFVLDWRDSRVDAAHRADQLVAQARAEVTR
ncbi:hypothetical protein D3C81_2289650 [compost metagenome]